MGKYAQQSKTERSYYRYPLIAMHSKSLKSYFFLLLELKPLSFLRVQLQSFFLEKELCDSFVLLCKDQSQFRQFCVQCGYQFHEPLSFWYLGLQRWSFRGDGWRARTQRLCLK